jgi:hypothetical protein
MSEELNKTNLSAEIHLVSDQEKQLDETGFVKTVGNRNSMKLQKELKFPPESS